jgi:outer membrane lipoprotein-sorting protein
MFILAAMSVFVFGCAAKATGPTLQEQLDTYKAAVESDHTAMAQKNAEQDSRLSEVESRLDRAFVKSK